MSDFRNAIASVLYDTARDQGVTVTLDTNVTPKVTVYDASASGPSLLDLLGIKAHVQVTTRDGATIAEYGSPPGKNYVLGFVYASVIVLGVVALGVAISRVLR